MNVRKTAAICFALTSTTFLCGEESVLSLDEVIGMTLERNFSYQIVSLNPEIAREAVIGQEAAFDLEIFANGGVTQSEQNVTFSQVTGTSSDSRKLEAGVRKRLAYGTTVTAQTNFERRDSNAGVNTSNLSQTAGLGISVRQPLLSGFGRDVNTAAIERAKAGFFSSVEAYRDAVQGILSQTELIYWSVARWQEQLELNKSSLEVADTLLRETKERERVGLATQIDVLQAEASRAERMEEIISTTYSLGDA
ncbi:MAG TPA: TolC family protein, partial [Oceanipulchritudo sp.]|nr:TolC family protein [Oceanipulchritudo sp.]